MQQNDFQSAADLFLFFSARNGLFMRTVAWPAPALHHRELSVIILRAEAWINMPASCLCAELKKRLGRFGGTESSCFCTLLARHANAL